MLFDAGLSGVQVEERLALHGRDVRGIEAVLISHDHSDHSRAMGIYQRKFGLPVHVASKTFNAAQANDSLGDMDDSRRSRWRRSPRPMTAPMGLPSSWTTVGIDWAS